MSAAEVLHDAESDFSVPRGVHWQEYAMCKGHTELFFARKAERPQARERREAKANRLCAACPVRVPCRTFAREGHEYGFWGGENEEDRHLLGYTVSAPIGIRARQAGSRPA
jgi:WhiB family redox-sensing transcriptional regulator